MGTSICGVHLQAEQWRLDNRLQRQGVPRVCKRFYFSVIKAFFHLQDLHQQGCDMQCTKASQVQWELRPPGRVWLPC